MHGLWLCIHNVTIIVSTVTICFFSFLITAIIAVILYNTLYSVTLHSVVPEYLLFIVLQHWLMTVTIKTVA